MKHVSFFILCLLLTGCYAVERDCADFKTGTFEFETLVGTEVVKTRFVRNDSIEIDYFRGSVDSSAIRWINDCEYVVKNLNPKNMAEKKSIHIKILTTKNNTYTFEFNEVGKTRKERGTAVKISDDTF